MRKARTNSNPFELIRGAIFQNRAAMKMANMDALLGWMFTQPKTVDGQSLVKVRTKLIRCLHPITTGITGGWVPGVHVI